MLRRLLVFTLAASCLFLQSCGLFRRVTGTPPPNDVAVSGQPPQSLLNFRQGREYAAQGRYELAKEQYLLAYAAAGENAAMRNAAAREIRAADMMIRTQR